MLFSSIQGQKHAVEYLRRSMAHQRVAHAILFTGPEGVGKRTTALVLAQAMNCEGTLANDACGTCLSCRKIAEGVHPDVQFIAPDGQNIKIEQIRETLQRGAVYQPLEGRTKFYIIDPADTLTLEAANSLLKLLEEPPANVVIVLITNQPFSLLETIRSRCQEIRFHPVEIKILGQWLTQRLGCPPEEALTLAMLSGGRPAEALRLADPDQKVLRAQALTVVQEIKPNEWAQNAGKLEEISAELPEIFMFLLTWYRDLLVLFHGGESALIINRDRLAELRKALQVESEDSLQAKCNAVMLAVDQMKKNINTQLLLENMFLQLGRPQLKMV